MTDYLSYKNLQIQQVLFLLLILKKIDGKREGDKE